MNKIMTLVLMMVVAFGLMSVVTGDVQAEQNFADLVGKVSVGDVQMPDGWVTIPYITWGGDMATFYANGGLQTTPDSIFGKMGLKIKLVSGDNPVKQAQDYMSGKSPFFRGTFRMTGGIASEVMGSDPKTKGYNFLQLTWSAGDHCVATGDVKTLNDVRWAIFQANGPHVGMFADMLETANKSWDSIEIILAKDLTGSKDSPAEMFKKLAENKGNGICFVITPDMIGLTGGLDNTGTGAEGTVKGARVLDSTAWLSYSIADTYTVRKDFYQNNSAFVEKFAAGFLKACEEIVELKKKYEAGGSNEYLALCKMGNEIFKLNYPADSEDGSLGMLLDCSFVGYPGNVAFYTDKNNQHGFDVFSKKSLELATSRGYVKTQNALFPSPLNWSTLVDTGSLKKITVAKTQKFNVETMVDEIEGLDSGTFDERTILSFSIEFDPDQSMFSADRYGSEYGRVIEALGKYGNAAIVVKGHSDNAFTLANILQVGLSKGTIKRTGSKDNYSYSMNGRPLDIGDSAVLITLVEQGKFDGISKWNYNPRDLVQGAVTLSKQRADAVKQSILKIAKAKYPNFDESRIQAIGVGIREPFISVPRTEGDRQSNRRVDFCLVKVSVESMNVDDFDF